MLNRKGGAESDWQSTDLNCFPQACSACVRFCGVGEWLSSSVRLKRTGNIALFLTKSEYVTDDADCNLESIKDGKDTDEPGFSRKIRPLGFVIRFTSIFLISLDQDVWKDPPIEEISRLVKDSSL